MQKLILFALIALFVFTVPSAAFAARYPDDDSASKVTNSCTMTPNMKSCSFIGKDRTQITAIKANDTYPLFIDMGPDMGAISMHYNHTYESRFGYTIGNRLNTDGSIVVYMTWNQ